MFFPSDDTKGRFLEVAPVAIIKNLDEIFNSFFSLSITLTTFWSLLDSIILAYPSWTLFLFFFIKCSTPEDKDLATVRDLLIISSKLTL